MGDYTIYLSSFKVYSGKHTPCAYSKYLHIECKSGCISGIFTSTTRTKRFIHVIESDFQGLTCAVEPVQFLPQRLVLMVQDGQLERFINGTWWWRKVERSLDWHTEGHFSSLRAVLELSNAAAMLKCTLHRLRFILRSYSSRARSETWAI